MPIGELFDIERVIQREIKFEWKISNFNNLPCRIDYYRKSPKFSFCGTHWYIEICPNGERECQSAWWIGLYVVAEDINTPITVDYFLQLKTVDGNIDIHSECTGTDVFDEPYDGAGTSKFIRRARLHYRMAELLPSGNLTIICTLKKSNTIRKAIAIETVDGFTQTEKEIGNATVDGFKQIKEGTGSATVGDDFTHKKEGIVFTKDLSEYKVLQDFKELYLKQTDCDVIIKVKGREFPAHQAILKARSPVLCSTFQVDMKEKATGVVEIDDCDPSTFSDFLCFLYCGEVGSFSVENVFGLFTIADKYDVADLRSQCLKFIKENLTVDSFCDTISLALLHSEADLIELGNNFFAKNAPNIIKTTKWQVFLVENPTVSNELFSKALASNKNSNEN